MRVAFNTALRGAGPGNRQTGITRYITELTNALKPELGPEDDLIMLGDHLRDTSKAIRILWEQTGLPVAASRAGASVLHGPMSVVPWASPVPSVMTVHDLAFLKFPGQVSRAKREWLSTATRLSAQRSARIITVSEHTKSDLIDWLSIDADKVVAIPLAPSGKIRRVQGDELHRFKEVHDLQRPFVLCVGTLEPRKNLPLLLRAFSAIRGEVEHDLVLVGPSGWLLGELKETLSSLNLGARVRMTGFVSDEELGGWYSAADLLAFPSLYEGFGLPTVEAMSCGTPVLASNTSCFPEVIGEAGVMVPPTDESRWSEALVSVLTSPGLRQDLAARGLVRAETFSWRNTAQRTMAVYRSAEA